jgi:hypothetical protein
MQAQSRGGGRKLRLHQPASGCLRCGDRKSHENLRFGGSLELLNEAAGEGKGDDRSSERLLLHRKSENMPYCRDIKR